MTDRKFTPPTKFPAEYVDGYGGKVTILGRSNDKERPLVGFDEDGYACNYAESGSYYPDDEGQYDLHDIPKRLTSWHNVYEDWVDAGGTSRKNADRGATENRLCVYLIERNEDGSNPEIFVEEA